MAKKRNENKIKYFEEICNIETMRKDNKSLREIYDYMGELIKYTFEDELKYISLPRTMEKAFEMNKQNSMDKNLIPQYIDLVIANSYKQQYTYQQGFCYIYGILTAMFDSDKINKKMDKDYKYTRDYIHF